MAECPRDAGLGRPRVVHYRRKLFEPTETFIHTLLTSLHRYEAVAVCLEAARSHLDFDDVRLRVPADRRRWLPAVRGLKVLTFAVPPLEKRRRDLHKRITEGWPHGRLTDMLKALSPALVHAHFLDNAEDVVGAVRSLHLPLVVSCYGVDVTAYPRLPGAAARVAKTFRTSSAVIALTEDMKRDLLALGCAEEKIRVVPHGVPANPGTREKRDRAVVLAAGRFKEKKGLVYFVRAAKALVEQRDDVDFEIAGTGELAEELQREAAGAPEGRIRFLGGVSYDELRKHLWEVDALVVPSVTSADGDKEGLPTIILDAMAAELPVIASRHAGIPDAVRDGETGVLVPERDVDGLVAAVRRLLDDPGERERMGRAGREEHERRFLAADYAKRIEAVYDEVLASRSSSASSR